jgi:hypothetical protein
MKKFLPFIFAFLFFVFFPKNAFAAASLSFSPANQTVALNQNFTVNALLSTGGAETDGADLIIRYDGNKLQVVSAALGTLYTNKVVEDTSTAGKITLRATSASDQSFNGNGTVATIVFKPIAEGTANVYFEFTSGSTTDTNVAFHGTDVLGSTTNATYTINQSGVGGANPSASPSIPVSGTVETTVALVGGGIGLVLLGLLAKFFLIF